MILVSGLLVEKNAANEEDRVEDATVVVDCVVASVRGLLVVVVGGALVTAAFFLLHNTFLAKSHESAALLKYKPK